MRRWAGLSAATGVLLMIGAADAHAVTVHYQDLDAFYGTGQAFLASDGTEVATIHSLQLTTPIPVSLAGQIQSTYPDFRVADGIGAWGDPSLIDTDWVLAPFLPLEASANLGSAITALPGPPVFEDDTGDVFQQQLDYFLASWTSGEEDHEGRVRIRYYERNYLRLVADPQGNLPAVPEPASIALTAAGFTGLLLWRRRRRHL